MATRRASRVLRPVAYAAGATAAGGGLLYAVYRPRNIPGSEDAAVPHPVYDERGVFQPPTFPAVRSRAEQIADLRRSGGSVGRGATGGLGAWLGRRTPPDETDDAQDEPYDLLVIGGGATGTGIALDAVTRGLKVALVERDDFASGTSSKSTKLVHGGVRYLEKAVWELDYSQYQLVREALRERRYFLDTAPHLSSWLPIMIPIDKWWKVPYFWAGTKFYDFLAGAENIESSYFLTKSKAINAFPMLRKDNLFGALVYYDGAHNDSRMNVSLAMTAALYGATVVNHMEVTSLEKDESGRLCGAHVKDRIDEANGKPPAAFRIRARGIVNATGPFTDSIRQMDDASAANIVAPSSGVHVVLPGYYSPSHMGLIDPSTSDGRVIFFLPWQGNTIAGTTDEPTDVTPSPVAGERQIRWILQEIRGYLQPEMDVRRGDVLAAWSGIRPLVRDPKATSTAGVVRNHLVTTSPAGLLTCSGGKWTTYRQMAEETVDEAVRAFALRPRALPAPPAVSSLDAAHGGPLADEPALDGSCRTHRVRLLGAHGFSHTLFIHLVQAYGLETDVARHLSTAYGDRAWAVAALSAPTDARTRFPQRGRRIAPLYPFVDGEVRYAVRCEAAQTAVDVLARRTRLAFLNARAALEALPGVLDIMAGELAWDARRRECEWGEAVRFLATMGLPEEMQGVTRREVERGAVGAWESGRGGLPARGVPPSRSEALHDITFDRNPVQEKESPANK